MISFGGSEDQECNIPEDSIKEVNFPSSKIRKAGEQFLDSPPRPQSQAEEHEFPEPEVKVNFKAFKNEEVTEIYGRRIEEARVEFSDLERMP
jgi:hypothetical protein